MSGVASGTDLAAEALFCSAVQRSDAPTWSEVRDVVHAVVFQVGEAACAGRVAQEFGDHPEASAERMRWCLAMVDAATVLTQV